ncbi:MAG: carboxylesterase family protein [Paludibacter sp.]|nr:carboxylesterase family protein [Paludibacter sp.]
MTKLSMDIYFPDNYNYNEKSACVIFVFGDGFSQGSRLDERNVTFCQEMSDSGYVVAAIDYRLGMKGLKYEGSKTGEALNRAIAMAVEDIYDATIFLIKDAYNLKIDKDKILLCGSGAGAIAVLQADYELANQMESSMVLPDEFRYDGVISFAGGILIHKGKPEYQRYPAATLFFHGEEDRIICYKHKHLFNYDFYGSDELVKEFKHSKYPYSIFRFQDIGHEISYLPMIYYKKEICQFAKLCSNDMFVEMESDMIIKDENLSNFDYIKMPLSKIFLNKD